MLFDLTPDQWNLLTCLILAGLLAFAVVCVIEAVRGGKPPYRDHDGGGL